MRYLLIFLLTIFTLTLNVKGQEIKFPDLSFNTAGDDIGVYSDEYNDKVCLFSYCKNLNSTTYYLKLNQWKKTGQGNYSPTSSKSIEKTDTSLKLLEVKRFENEYWLICQSKYSQESYTDLYLYVLDSSLNIKKEQFLIQLSHEPLFSKTIRYANEKKLAIINCSFPDAQNSEYTYPVFLSLDSELTLTQHYFLTDSIGYRVEDVWTRNDSSLLLLTTKNQSETHFLEINPNSYNVSFLKSYSDLSQYKYAPLISRGQYLSYANNSVKIFSASDSFNTTTYSNVAITSLDSNYNIISKSTILSPAKISNTEFYTYILPWYGVYNLNSTSTFIGASYIRSPIVATLNSIVKLDSNFNFDWEYQFNKVDTFIRIIHISNTSDGGCLVVANSYTLDKPNSDFNIIFFKLSKPTLSNGIENFINLKNESTMIYPNPFQNQIHVNNNQKKITRLKIINQSSQILIDKEVKHSEPLNTQFIQSGIYYLQVQFEDGSSYFQKMIKQ